MKKYGVVLTILLCVISGAVNAQQVTNAGDQLYSFEFSGEKLSDALKKIVAVSGVDLIYDPTIVDDKIIYARVRNKDIHAVLTSVLTGTGLDFIILSTGTYVIVMSSLKEPAKGSISGRIMDANTREPLPGATVMLADASGGTASNMAGHFNLNSLLPGSHELIFSFVGYQPVKKTIQILPDENVREQIYLSPGTLDFKPVIVSAHKPFITASHKAAYHHDEMRQWNAGNHSENVIQGMGIFPGVQTGIAFTDIHIHGGHRGDHRIFLDGIPIYNPYSFGQMFSAFSPYAIGRIEVEKSGSGASSGSFMSGRINMNHELDGSRSKFLTQADPLSVNLLGNASVNLQDDRNLYVMSAYRTSVWDVYREPSLSSSVNNWDLVDPLVFNILQNELGINRAFVSAQNDNDISFSDFHTALRLDLGHFHTIGFSLYTGHNAVQTDVLAFDRNSSDRMFGRDSYHWNNIATQLNYNWLATPRFDLSFQATYSENSMNHTYTMFDEAGIQALGIENEDDLFTALTQNIPNGISQFDENLIQHFILNADAGYSFSPQFKLTGGLQFDYVNSRFELSDLFYLPTNNRHSSNIFSTWFSADFRITPNLRAETGSRFTFLNNGTDMYAEPRISLQFDQHETSVGYWSVKLTSGIYRQFINQFEISNVGPSSIVPYFTIWAHDSSIRQPLSYNSTLSFILEPTSGTSFTAESWVRFQPAAYVTSPRNLMVGANLDRDGFDAFAEVTDINMYGFSFRAEQHTLGGKLNILAGYDYSYASVNKENQFGRSLQAPWVDPHRLQMRLIARPISNIAVVGSWQGIYGRSWAFRQAYYDFLVPHNITEEAGFDFTHPESDKLPAFHQVDVSLIYFYETSFMNSEIRLNFINVLNRKNVIDWNLIYQEGSQLPVISERTLPGFSPSLSIRLVF